MAGHPWGRNGGTFATPSRIGPALEAAEVDVEAGSSQLAWLSLTRHTWQMGSGSTAVGITPARNIQDTPPFAQRLFPPSVCGNPETPRYCRRSIIPASPARRFICARQVSTPFDFSRDFSSSSQLRKLDLSWRSRSPDMPQKSGTLSRARRRVTLARVWIPWRRLAASQGQRLRCSQQASARQFLSFRFRAWRKVHSIGFGLEREEDEHSDDTQEEVQQMRRLVRQHQQQQAARFVRSRMDRVRAAAAAQRVKSRVSAALVSSVLGIWCLLCALAKLSAHALAARELSLESKAFSAMQIHYKTTLSVRRSMRRSGRRTVAPMLAVWRLSCLVELLAKRVMVKLCSGLKSRAFRSLEMRVQRKSTLRFLARRWARRIVSATLEAWRLARQLSTLQASVSKRQVARLASTSFGRWRHWHEDLATVEACRARRMETRLRSALASFSSHLHVARAQKLKRQIAVEVLACRMRQLTLRVLKQHAQSRIEFRRCRDSVAIAKTHNRMRLGLRSLRTGLWRKYVVEDFSQWLVRRRAQAALRSMRKVATLAKMVDIARLGYSLRLAKTFLSSWAFAIRVKARIRALPGLQTQNVRAVASLLAYGCSLPNSMRFWRAGVAQQGRERIAIRHFEVRSATRVRPLFASWAALVSHRRASCANLLRCHCGRVFSDVFFGWHLRTRLFCAARSIKQRRSLVLAQASLKLWLSILLEQRQFRATRTEIFHGWIQALLHCRCTRDEALRSRWADGVAEDFASRRLLRAFIDSFFAWMQRSSSIAACLADLESRKQACLTKSVFDVFVISRFLRKLITGISRPVDREKAVLSRWALRRMRINSWVRSLAKERDLASLSRIWQVMSRVVRRRRGAARIACVLSSRCSKFSLCRLAEYARALGAVEGRGIDASKRRCCAYVLAAWRSHSMTFGVSADLWRAVMVSWHRVAQTQVMQRRFERLHALGRWRGFVQSCHAGRRRIAVAILSAGRRLRRRALLTWQLHCFEETAAPELLDRWSDNVSAPARLAPNAFEALIPSTRSRLRV